MKTIYFVLSCLLFEMCLKFMRTSVVGLIQIHQIWIRIQNFVPIGSRVMLSILEKITLKKFKEKQFSCSRIPYGSNTDPDPQHR